MNTKVKIAALGGLAVLAIACGSSAKPTANPPITGTGSSAARPTTAAPAAPAGPKTTFGDGQYLVGTDIAPGQYRTTVPTDSPMCYWERQKDTSGNPGSIIANGVGQPGTAVIVTIATTDHSFKVSGCGNWKKA